MKLLLVSNDAYSLFNKATLFPFGGAELRAWKFASGLHAQFNADVAVITIDQGKGEAVFDGVKLYPHPERKGPGYWEKFRRPVNRLLRRLGLGKQANAPEEKLETLIARIAPDIIMTLGMSPEAVRLQRYAKQNRTLFVFGCASDVDLSAEFVQGASGTDRTGNDLSGYWEVFAGADLLLVQTPFQQELLEQRFHRKGELLYNPVELSAAIQAVPGISRTDLFWVGKVSTLKRPELFMNLARALPQYRFRMIANGAAYPPASVPANLEIIEAVPFEQMDAYFHAARIFVNTSAAEGFANTFLQAAKAGLPVVSMCCDPNGMLTAHGAGLLTGDDPERLNEGVRLLLGDEARAAAAGEAGKKYVAQFHSENKILAQLHELLSDLLRKRTA